MALVTAHYTQAVCVGFRLSFGELECAAGRRAEALPWCLPNRECSANIYRANAYLHEIVTRVVLQTHDRILALQTNPGTVLNPGKMKALLLGDPFACFWNISNMKALSKVGEILYYQCV